MEDPRIISALFIFLKMAYYNVLININKHDAPFLSQSYLGDNVMAYDRFCDVPAVVSSRHLAGDAIKIGILDVLLSAFHFAVLSSTPADPDNSSC